MRPHTGLPQRAAVSGDIAQCRDKLTTFQMNVMAHTLNLCCMCGHSFICTQTSLYLVCAQLSLLGL